MPRLRAFGRQWATGSDDVAIPASINALVAGSWFGVFLYTSQRHRHAFHCLGGDSFHNFYTYSLVLTGLEIAVIGGMIRTSLKGTMINWEPRKNISFWIGLYVVVKAVGIVFSIQSARWIFYQPTDCQEFAVNGAKLAIKLLWAEAFISVLGMFSILKSVKKEDHLTHSEHSLDWGRFKELQNVSVWKILKKGYKRLKLHIKRILRIQPDPYLSKISEFFSSYFEEKLDIVPTDVMMALLTLAKEQEEKNKGEMLRKNPHDEPISPKPWMRDTKLMAHYFRFAYGAYGWWPYFVMSEKGAFLKLLKIVIKGRYIPRGLPVNIEGDNRLLANTTALQILTGLDMQDLVYVCFTNQRFELPFFVALDHKHQAIVVAIRGTLSIEDAIVDLYCFSQPIPSLDGAEAHEGMLEAAMKLKQKLIHGDRSLKTSLPLLELAQERLIRSVGHDKAASYKLVITGHSLGAGVAGVLAVLMKEIPQYHDLKCFAFSPPAGLLSKKAAKYAEKFVCSVILGDDIVGRLGMTQAYSFKAKILKIIQNCDTPKHEIFGDWLEAMMTKLLKIKRKKSDLNTQPSWTGNEKAEREVLEFQKHIQEEIDKTFEEKHRLPLYPPGCVVHIHEHTKTSLLSLLGGRKSLYDAAFNSCQCKLFARILLVPDLIKHHLPWEVMHALDYLAQNGVEPYQKHFTGDTDF